MVVMLMSKLGDRIRKLREKRNISQKRLAQSLGITNVQLSRYESGDRKPDPDMIVDIASFFGCSTDYLLGRVDDPDLYSNREEAEKAMDKEGLKYDGGDLSKLSEAEMKLIEGMIERFLQDKE